MLNLAELYTELGDTQKAIHYYKKAAESGNESAICVLCILLMGLTYRAEKYLAEK